MQVTKTVGLNFNYVWNVFYLISIYYYYYLLYKSKNFFRIFSALLTSFC